MTMDNKTKYLAIAVLSLMGGLMLRSCLGRQPVSSKPVVTADFPSTDTVRVAVRDNVLQVQTPTSNTFSYVPEEGQAVIDVNHQGIPTVTVKNKGFTRQLGASVLLADKLRVGVDCEFAYWNRLGSIIGIGFGTGPIVVGYVGMAYQLDQLRLNNTSLWLGYTTSKNVAVGVRVSF